METSNAATLLRVLLLFLKLLQTHESVLSSVLARDEKVAAENLDTNLHA